MLGHSTIRAQAMGLERSLTEGSHRDPAELDGQPFMTTCRAVHRLTAEIADYLGIDGGTLAPGRPGLASS